MIVFSKRLSAFRSVLRQPELSTEPVLEHQDNLGLHVRRATTAHVPQLIDLIYRTYRYSYAHSEWYDENNFRKVIEDKRIIALIAETNAGAVIGSLIIHFDSPQLAELGALMTDPNYRASKAVALLAKEYVHLLRDAAFKNTIFYVELVTTHAQSQRLVNLFKFAAVGLRLSVYDRARFIGINEATRQRESHVFSVLTTRLAGKSVTGYAAPLPPHTSITNTPDSTKRLLEMEVAEFGLDFTTILKKETLVTQQNGFITCILSFPLDQPLPPVIERTLRENKYFFSGLQIKKDSRWYLLYTNLFQQRFQFPGIEVYDPITRELRDYVEEQYLSLY